MALGLKCINNLSEGCILKITLALLSFLAKIIDSLIGHFLDCFEVYQYDVHFASSVTGFLKN